MGDAEIIRSPRHLRSVPRLTRLPSRRVVLVAGLLLLLAAGAYGCRHAGTFLVAEDPLTPADAIFVLAGTRVERPLEAADLYFAGYAPRIVLTRTAAEQEATDIAGARGGQIATSSDAARDLLLSLGVPAGGVVVPARLHDNTAEEAATLRALATEHAWTQVIVVSSPYHLRRTALACRRALRGTGVRVIMRGTRYDTSTPERWWTRRADVRWLASEFPKLIAYAVGAGE